MIKFIEGFDNILEKISRWGLVSSFFVLMGLAVTSILLRWMGMSPPWIDPLTRHLVFLSAFLGGSLATSKGVHIRVDLLTKAVEASSSKVLHWMHRNLVAFFCFVVCFYLFKASWDFFMVEREFGAPAFLNIHSMFLVGIIPFGMGLITLRFFNLLFLGLIHGEKREHRSV